MPQKLFKTVASYLDLKLLVTSLLALAVMLVTFSTFAQSQVIKIDGSSTVFPITEAMAEEFMKDQKGAVRIIVGISGTGGGFKKFCRGEIDVQNASRPILTAEMEACKKAGVKYFELPVAYDAIAIVVNPANALTEISASELKTMWAPQAQGKITKWSQVNAKWPDQVLKLYGAGSDSGTFDYFTEAIVGKSKSSRGDYTASEDDNTLVTGIANDKGALGYIPYAYYEENKNKLKLLAVIGGAKAPTKKAVLPSRETVEKGTYFPLSRPIFIYVSEAAHKRNEVANFVKFFTSKATTIIPEVKYIPLPAKAYELVDAHVKKGKVGTMFGGHSEVGLKIEDLMKREGKL